MRNLVVAIGTLFIMLLISNELLADGIGKGLNTYNHICIYCHGKDAKGDVAPNIVGAGSSKIEYAINNIDVMKFIKNRLSKKNIVNVAAYLLSIDKNKLTSKSATTKLFLGKPANTRFMGCN